MPRLPLVDEIAAIVLTKRSVLTNLGGGRELVEGVDERIGKPARKPDVTR